MSVWKLRSEAQADGWDERCRFGAICIYAGVDDIFQKALGQGPNPGGCQQARLSPKPELGKAGGDESSGEHWDKCVLSCHSGYRGQGGHRADPEESHQPQCRQQQPVTGGRAEGY